MATKSVDKDRKAKIAELQRQAKAKERKRTLTIIGAAGVVVVVMAGAVTYAIASDDNRVPGGELATLGVTAAAASCDAVTNDPSQGSTHTEGTLKYATVPPTTGNHNPVPVYPSVPFYSADDRPQMEKLVHNLEHGYTVLWYDSTATAAQQATLKAIGEKARDTNVARDKFIVSSWDPAYGAFPQGKHFALAHWSADAAAPTDVAKQFGHREMCGDISGAVVNDFIAKYPLTSAPEVGAQ